MTEQTATTDTTSTEPGFLARLPWYAVPATLIGVPVLIWILTLINQQVFYDQFVWQYYWGPIKADAAGRALASPGGVVAQPGYNPVNTATWAILMGVCIVGLSQLIEGLRIKLNHTVILGAALWTVSGAVFHVLEDTGLLAQPLQFFFITPPIYLLFAAFGVVSIIVGWYLERVADDHGIDRALHELWMFYASIVLLYTIMWATGWSQVLDYINPVHAAVLAAITYMIHRIVVVRRGVFDGRDLVLTSAVYPLLVAVDYILLWNETPWNPAIDTSNAMPSAVILAPALAAAATALVYVVARAIYKRKESWKAAVFMAPINLVLVFSQMVDGFATSIGLDLLHYREKHLLSAWVIDTFRNFAENIGWEFGAEHPTFLAFAPLKLAVSLLVVAAIDIYSREDVKKYPTLIGFVKFGIIMVGIGPGVRDFVRMAMGV